MIAVISGLPEITPSLTAASFVGAIAASALLTWLARIYALRRQLLDHPGQRRSHVLPTPRGGGIGPVVVLLAGGCAIAAIDPSSRSSLLICVAGLAAVAGIGWVDDHRPLPAWIRLVIHLCAGLAASLALLGLPQTLLQFTEIAVSTLVVAGLVNAWNFMDGIDGIATSQAALVALIVVVGSWLPVAFSATGWLTGGWLLFALLLLASSLGFLPFNMPRARIFLGDVGSGALGFVIACVLLRAVATGAIGWPLAALPVSAFLIDAGMTLLSRMLKGKKWWRPHREHVYQWMVRSGNSHLKVTLRYAVWTLCAGALAVTFTNHDRKIGEWVSGAGVLCGSLFWIWIRNRLWIAARDRH